ncbi:MAG: VWA domain-containing protein [Dehalococcoidia bacterium]
MTFAWPYALVLVLLAPLLLAVYLVMLRRRRRFAVSFASLSLIRDALPRQSRWRRRVPFALLLLSLLSLAVAAARPQAVAAVPMNRTTIILALDVSLSMCSTDVAPNRLAVAQEVARTFVADQPGGTRVGLVAFSGGAQLVAPPTTDRKPLLAAIDALRAGRGTAVGTALLRSIDAISTVNAGVTRSDADAQSDAVSPLPPGAYQPDIIVLLTDGATTQGFAPLKAAQLAADRQLRVYAIGFGTTAAAPLTCSPEQLGSDVFANQFAGGGGRGGVDGPARPALRIDERTLQSIADMTGGAYYRAGDAAELVDVFKDLPREIVLQKQHVEISFAFAAAGALLALLAVILSLAWNRSS